MAETIFTDLASDTDMRGTLFQGIKFWISQKVPMRSRFLNDVKINGGDVLPLEKNADVKIVDHARKETPPGSHSYTFIEKSISNGALEDLDDHRVGPPEGTVRSIGSVVQPAKGTRNKYTEADDRILCNWVNENPQKGGGTDGNEIYKQLEKKHPQHPWQSWRDRWIKHLKGRKATGASFSLPHNAPPTPPSDVPQTAEPSKNPATASDTAEDDHHSFSDDDAEALMAVGDDIENIYPDNIPAAWESWTRDFDKDGIHTPQQWRSYWEESVRPRYLRRKAKQTERNSPMKTIPAKSQVPISPKRIMTAPTSASSPFKKHQSHIPQSQHEATSRTQNPTSPKRATAAPPSSFSPDSRSQCSLVLESPKSTSSFRVQDVVSPKRPMSISQTGFSSSHKKVSSPTRAGRTNSEHPEPPTVTSTVSSKNQKVADDLSLHMPSLISSNEQHTPRTPEKPRSPYHETLKRKHNTFEDDLPSSSPMGPISPKRRRPRGLELPIEIASTPEKGRELNIEVSSSPLSIKLEYEEDEPKLPALSSGIHSPLGQQLSDTLSEPGNVVKDTQAVFNSATPLIDFDVPAPEGGWGDEEFLVQDSSQPVSLDLLPSMVDSREDNNDGIKESTQLMNFDLAPPDGGWGEQDPEIKSESESEKTEIYDPQPTLPDTQALLRSKTPAPDFTIPDPDGGWNNLIGSSPPVIPSSPRAESVFSQTDLGDQLDAWIDAHAVNGASVETVESVLKSTSMDTALAHKALRHLAKKGALPTTWRGVWTGSDDEDLGSTDARRIQRLQEKHGAECFKARFEFLEFYAEAGDEG